MIQGTPLVCGNIGIDAYMYFNLCDLVFVLSCNLYSCLVNGTSSPE